MGVFKIALKDDESYINGIGRLEAQIQGEGAAKWFQNGKEIPADASILKFEAIARDEMRALVVKNCSATDFCKYAIEVNGEKSEASLKKMSPFLSKMQNESGKIQGIAVFSCEVRPSIQVCWYFGDRKITRAEFSILKYEESSSGNIRKLIVKNITNQDLTNFSCEAKGEKCTAKLEKAKESDKKTTDKKKSNVKNADAKKAPQKGITFNDTPEIKVSGENDAAFAEKVHTQRAQEGTIEVFQCKLKNATDTVVWYTPKDMVINSKNFSILKYETSEDGPFRKLIVKNIQNGDGGSYHCESGESKISFKLNVGNEPVSSMNALQVGGMNLGIKRRGSVVDKNKEAGLLKALQRANATYKWIRHPDYLNLWIINPGFAAMEA